MSHAYEQLIDHWRRLAVLGSVSGLLAWDQRTMMPAGGLALRGDQTALLSEMAHAMATDRRVGDWLAACEADVDLTADPTLISAVNLREIRRDYDRATKLPAKLVGEFSRATTAAHDAWTQARRDDKFGLFRPHLQRVVELNIERAKCFGWAADGEPWDALADGFEPGMTAAAVAGVFTPLREQLVALIDELFGKGQPENDAFDRVAVPADRQMRFVRFVVERIGFDFQRGRLDPTVHPFCSGMHFGDVRLTTRFHDDFLTDALSSTMHEAGHGIYNQGLPPDRALQPAGDPVGLSIHESQSRLWENQVGRSAAFWDWCFPKLAQYFGDAFEHLTTTDAYASANRVRRSLIRVEADEATYNLHIMIRFELERRMLRGDLAVADLPAAWNDMYREYLGVEVPDDRRGCLQDVHWSNGAMGYFPTYTLGNLYAAQFFESASEALGDLHAMFAAGEFAPLRHWLNQHIHALGRTYTSEALCEQVTGRPVSAEPLMRHLEAKLRPLYAG